MRTRSFNCDVISAEVRAHRIGDYGSQLASNLIHIGYRPNRACETYVEAAAANIKDLRATLDFIEAEIAKVMEGVPA
jgi:hypothetical protein